MYFSYCFLLLLQLLVQLKLPFNLRINIWYYRAPELIFGATKYTTAIDICSRYSGVDQVVEIIKIRFISKF
ncbi:hypothetical protein ES288_A08G130300v1 [Gossypium darwinii]|uniref:Secreted protein n=1 Tax=Gossypium darwinii TaxID=34276 RepID=A0A5D2FKW1_GOSDA|nr:hypothetical protein ES288_A08G130300v1 [Gossypium darwinii]